ncbi:MAG: L-threonine dehydratase catabolic TdcB [Candidatus Heimdallarchaeota archaeon LC_2]|nr:MAG: L-threonine dehydratase catabolic TdcB [Candidatus Heimdallarchaeota archaeon LC_2]
MNKPHSIITLEQIKQAHEVIKSKINRTPVIKSFNIAQELNINLFYKAELYQKTGSFKVRGVFNKLHNLTKQEKEKGIITISAGNHAKAIAYAAWLEGVKAMVIMPDYAPKNKIESTQGYGAIVVQTESNNLLNKLNQMIEETKMTLIHPFGDLDILAGQATVGLELIEDVDTVIDTVIVPIGGGGLISGVAAAIKLTNSNINVIGVEPKGANVMSLSLDQDKVVTMDYLDTIADGLAAPFTSIQTLAHTKQFVDRIVLVSDDEIRAAMKTLVLEEKIVAEPAGAASFAALLSDKIAFENGQNIVCILSGSNVDDDLLKSVINE